MYPLLARRSHLAVYLLLWMLMGILLAAILALQGGLPWTTALLAGLPMAVAYSFICLSAWYVARSMPLAGTGAIRVVATALAAAVVSADKARPPSPPTPSRIMSFSRSMTSNEKSGRMRHTIRCREFVPMSMAAIRMCNSGVKGGGLA